MKQPKVSKGIQRYPKVTLTSKHVRNLINISEYLSKWMACITWELSHAHENSNIQACFVDSRPAVILDDDFDDDDDDFYY